MTEERHDALATAFARALELEQDARDEYVRALRASDPTLAERLDALLAADSAAGARRFDTPASTEAARALRDSAGDAAEAGPPARVGDYRVLGELGRGGAGIVYEAEQERPRRRVALKVLRPGLLDEVHRRRFELEGEILARLEHPGIARVYGVGRDRVGGEVRSFIAMERIDGLPLDRFAREARLGRRERVALLASVAEAVAHAHSRGVVHRDLKPANVLVDAEGRPKVLDFGIARALDDELGAGAARTRTGELVGTLATMSPEQAAGDPAAIGTPTDVYALGVLGFLLLCGRYPRELEARPLGEALRSVAEEAPPRPSSIDPALRGDLETILLHALELDPQRRYASAAELAADLRRHLDDLPVVARPPSATYQLAKFARRHRAWVVGAAAVVVVLAGGAATSTALYLQSEDRGDRLAGALGEANAATEAARAERTRAQASVEELLAAEQFFDEMLGKASPYEDGDSVRVVDVLERTVARLDQFTGPPPARARLLGRLGSTLHALGRSDEARPLFERALAIYADHPESDSLQVARVEGLLALSLWDRYHDERVLPPLESAIARYAAAGEAGLSGLVRLRIERVNVYTTFSRFEDAEAEAARAVAEAERLGPAYATDLAQARVVSGQVAMEQGLYPLARERVGSGVDLLRETHGSDALVTVEAEHLLAVLSYYTGDLEQARALSEHALAVLEDRIGGDHPDLVGHLEVLCVVNLDLGRLADARAAIDRGVAMGERLFERDSMRLASLLTQRAGVHELAGDFDAAFVDYARAIEALRTYPPSLSLASALSNAAALHRQRGRSEDALPLAREAVRVQEQLGGPDDLRLGWSVRNLALILEQQGRLEESLEWHRRGLAIARAHEAQTGPDDVVERAGGVGGVLVALGREAEAREVLEAHWSRVESHPNAIVRALFASDYGLALLRTGDADRGATLVREASEDLARALGPDGEVAPRYLDRGAESVGAR